MADMESWVVTSNSRCLCEARQYAQPGCECVGGGLSWLLQAGLVGTHLLSQCTIGIMYHPCVVPPNRHV